MENTVSNRDDVCEGEGGNKDELFDSSYEIKLWDDLDINPQLLRGIFAYGFEKPSLVSIPHHFPCCWWFDFTSCSGKTRESQE